jgi:hypothetical protein
MLIQNYGLFWRRDKSSGAGHMFLAIFKDIQPGRPSTEAAIVMIKSCISELNTAAKGIRARARALSRHRTSTIAYLKGRG